MTSRPRLRFALSVNLFAPDPDRVFYPPSTLLYVEEQMAAWVSSSGALAYPVPRLAPQSAVDLNAYVDDLDGLVLTGGADVCPRTYGQEPMRPAWEGDAMRDRYEIELLEAFVAAGKPVLGICRGAQVLNVAFGGTLHQDIATQVGGDVEHRHQQRYHHLHHDVDLVPGSWLASLYPAQPRVRVNSIHHQAVDVLAPDMVVEARSSEDGVVEAIRLDRPDTWVRGVQWHPEFFALTPDDGLVDCAPLLDAFCDEAERVRASHL